MHIFNLYNIKCIILHKLRHTWTFVVFIVKVFDYWYKKAINQQELPQHNNNNNNNIMEQENQDEAPEVPEILEQQRQAEHQQPQLLNQGPAEFAAIINAILEEPMDANNAVNEDADDVMDIDDEEGDVDDDDNDTDDSDPELEEMYSDNDWTTSNDESEMSTTISNVVLGQIDAIIPQKQSRPMYSFQPGRLIKCQFKDKHCIGGFPVGRSGHRIIASNSHLYSLGGYNPRSAMAASRYGRCLLFQELWSYNFATNRWTLELNADNASNMPTELASNALAIHNDVLISHGGTGYPFGESCSNDCYVYRVTGGTAGVDRLKVSGDLPTAQYGPGIVIHKNYLYTIGGTTGFDYSCDVYRLDLSTKVWENVYICRPEMREDPEGRYRHEVVNDGKHIFVLGGGTSNSVYDLQRIPAYNLEANRWDYFDTLPDRSCVSWGKTDKGYPKPRKCFSCVQHQLSNGDIEAFITGGLQGDFSTYFSDIWKLNLRTKQWSIIQSASLPRPLYFHSAAHSDNGCMYIFGGIEYNEKDTLKRRNDLYKMWMTIPKLSEMCWDAITYYNDNLDLYDRKKLLMAGIPKRFTERLPPQRGVLEEDSTIMTSLYAVEKRPRVRMQ